MKRSLLAVRNMRHTHIVIVAERGRMRMKKVLGIIFLFFISAGLGTWYLSGYSASQLAGSGVALVRQENVADSASGSGVNLESNSTSNLESVQDLKGEKKAVIVIDPGHGGMDGGASSADGTLEKDINLAIAKKLKEQAEQYPVKVLMTRETDAGLYSESGDTIRSKKRADLLNRKKILEEECVTIGISIHLNSFPQDEKVYGAQVFYPKGSEKKTHVQTGQNLSRTLAESIQKSIETNIEDGRTREAMTKNDILLFQNTQANLVLVECGFLSNRQECEKLKTTEYQELLAKSIWEGINENLCLKKIQKTDVLDSANKQKNFKNLCSKLCG